MNSQVEIGGKVPVLEKAQLEEIQCPVFSLISAGTTLSSHKRMLRNCLFNLIKASSQISGLWSDLSLIFARLKTLIKKIESQGSLINYMRVFARTVSIGKCVTVSLN